MTAETPEELAARLWAEAHPFGECVADEPRKDAWLAEVVALVRERDALPALLDELAALRADLSIALAGQREDRETLALLREELERLKARNQELLDSLPTIDGRTRDEARCICEELPPGELYIRVKSVVEVLLADNRWLRARVGELEFAVSDARATTDIFTRPARPR